MRKKEICNRLLDIYCAFHTISLGPGLWEFYNYPEHIPDLSFSRCEREPQGSIFPPGKDKGRGSLPPMILQVRQTLTTVQKLCDPRKLLSPCGPQLTYLKYGILRYLPFRIAVKIP